MGLYVVFTLTPGHGHVVTTVSSQVYGKLNLPLFPVTSELGCTCVCVCVYKETKNLNVH